jgi:GAF domain-containing protein
VNSQESLAEVFVQIADTLVADFDIIDFLQHLCDRCVELLGVDAAGLLLADPQNQLQIMAATSEQARLLELFQLQSGEGPCLDCHQDGRAVVIPDVAAVTARWPQFAPACQQAGFAAVHAMPMRCRDQIVGAMNLSRLIPVRLSRRLCGSPKRSPTPPRSGCCNSGPCTTSTCSSSSCRPR